MPHGGNVTETLTEHVTAYVAKVESERSRLASQQARYFLADLPASLDARTLDTWRTSLKAGKLSPLSINRKLTEARSFLLWLSRTDRLAMEASKIRDVLTFYRADSKKVDIPGQDAIAALIRLALDKPGTFGQSYCLSVSLGLFAGLRPGEIEAVTAADLPEGKAYIQVRKTKTGRDRHAYYKHSAVLSIVLPELRKRAEGNLVKSGGGNWFAAAAAQAGWSNVKRNMMRKICATYMACSGRFSEYELTSQLGHTSAVSIKHYRDPSVLDTINPGTTIEDWMGVADLVQPLVARILGGA